MLTTSEILSTVCQHEVQIGGSRTAHTDDSNISDYAKEAVNRLYVGAIISGYPDSSVKPQGEATRAEVAAMMMRFLEAME